MLRRITTLCVMPQESQRVPSETSVPGTLPLQGGDALSQTASRNLAVAMSLRETAWRLTEAGVQTFRPSVTEAEVQAEVRAQFRRTTG